MKVPIYCAGQHTDPGPPLAFVDSKGADVAAVTTAFLCADCAVVYTQLVAAGTLPPGLPPTAAQVTAHLRQHGRKRTRPT